MIEQGVFAREAELISLLVSISHAVQHMHLENARRELDESSTNRGVLTRLTEHQHPLLLGNSHDHPTDTPPANRLLPLSALPPCANQQKLIITRSFNHKTLDFCKCIPIDEPLVPRAVWPDGLGSISCAMHAGCQSSHACNSNRW